MGITQLLVLAATAVVVTVDSSPAVATSQPPPPLSGGLVVVPEGDSACDSPAEAEAATAAPSITDKIRLGPDFDGAGSSDAATAELPPPPPFVATEEWQQVLPGQHIPPGLHVSIDMQTGEKKAKLMDDQVGIQTSSELAAAQRAAVGRIDDGPTARAGRETNASTATAAEGGLTAAEVRKIQLDGFMARVAELKAQGVRVRADTEAMGAIIAELDAAPHTDEGDAEAAELLEALEGYAHQVDNAVDLNSMGGLEAVVEVAADRSRSRAARALAAVVVGAAASNNPAATDAAVELGAVRVLLALAREYADSGGTGLAPDRATELKRVLYAVSALLRHAPAAATQFVDLGGVPVLTSLLRPTTPAKVLVKAATAMADLMLEQAEVLYLATHGAPYTYDGGVASAAYTSELWTRFAGVTAVAVAAADAGWCAAATAPGVLDGDGGQELQESLLLGLLGLHRQCAPVAAVSPAVADALETLAVQWAAMLAEEAEDGLGDGYAAGLVDLVTAVRSLYAAPL